MSSTLECQSCGAALAVEAGQRTAKRVYCASPSIVVRPPSADRPEPAFVIGVVVPPERALETARRWVKKPLLAPEAFRPTEPGDIEGSTSSPSSA